MVRASASSPRQSRPRCLLTEPKQTSRRKAATSEFVKVFGCRPHEGGAAHTGAGVRKPPREETAGGARGWRGVGYGDLSAADDVSDWS